MATKIHIAFISQESLAIQSNMQDCGRLAHRPRVNPAPVATVATVPTLRTQFEPPAPNGTFQPAASSTLSMRIVLIIFFIAIIASLGSALYYMVGQRHTSGAPDKRMARALAIRVGLSVTAFVLLMAGYYFGLIPAQR